MEDDMGYNVKVYSTVITDTEKNMIQKENKRNPKFEINSQNIQNFVDCDSIIMVLEENNIPYKIEIEGAWTETVNHRQVYNPNEQVCFYIRDRDYIFYKSILEKLLESDYDNQEIDNIQYNNEKQENIKDDFSNTVLKTGGTFVTLIIIIIGAIFTFIGISFITDQDIFSGLIFIILSIFFFLTAYKTNKKDNQKTE